MDDSYLLATLYWRNTHLSVSDFLLLGKLHMSGVPWSGLARACPNPELRSRLESLGNWWDLGKRELETCQKENLRLLRVGDSLYPPALLELPRPPWLISYWGQECWLEPCLSVVGSRQCSSETLSYLDELLSQLLQLKSLTLISGGARGIDQKAHSVALRAQRPTLCLLPSGLCEIYPKNLKPWTEGILASGGALMSQFSPLAEMRKHHFHWRNQLIAALSSVVFVVLASQKSGTMITARWARTLHRDLATLPFPAWQKSALGNLQLLEEGAHMIRDAEDLLVLVERSHQVSDSTRLGSTPLS